MSLQSRINDLILAVGTDYKQLRTWMTGSSTGALTSLTTTDKSSLINAINEVKAGSTGAPPAASETVSGIAEVATQAEVTTGTDDLRIVTPLKLAQRLSGFVTSAATETASGIAEIATQAETTTGTDDVRFVTPLKLAQKLSAWAQPLNANLTTLAGVTSGVFGRTLLGAADATAAKTSLGLAAVATSGNFSDMAGTLSTAQIPPIAINETFPVATQAAMLALTAQRGDIAVRSDLGGKMFILTTDVPSVLGNWTQIVAAGDVVSVSGRTGAVTLTKSDVGLSAVDNTADSAKPVSTAQAAADALNLKIASNLSDLQNAVSARANLAVYSTTELGNPETDLVALYTTAKA